MLNTPITHDSHSHTHPHTKNIPSYLPSPYAYPTLYSDHGYPVADPGGVRGVQLNPLIILSIKIFGFSIFLCAGRARPASGRVGLCTLHRREYLKVTINCGYCVFALRVFDIIILILAILKCNIFVLLIKWIFIAAKLLARIYFSGFADSR